MIKLRLGSDRTTLPYWSLGNTFYELWIAKYEAIHSHFGFELGLKVVLVNGDIRQI